MFWQLLRLENDRTFRRLLPWVGLLCALVPSVLTLTLLFAFLAGTPEMPRQSFTWPGGIANMLRFAAGSGAGYGYGLYLLVILTAIIMGQDYSWRTVQLWLSRGCARSHLLIARFAQLALAALLITLAFLLVGIVLALIFASLSQSRIDFSALDLAQLLLSYLRTAYSMLPYLALTLLIAVLTRSTVVAIGAGIVFMAAIEVSLSFLLPALGEGFARVSQFFPYALALNLNQENLALAHTAVKHTALQPSPLVAVLCITAYTLVLFGITVWAFRRQDLTN